MAYFSNMNILHGRKILLLLMSAFSFYLLHVLVCTVLFETCTSPGAMQVFADLVPGLQKIVHPNVAITAKEVLALNTKINNMTKGVILYPTC